MSGYVLEKQGDGSWSVLDRDTRRPITYQGRLQIDMTEAAAREAVARLGWLEREFEPPADGAVAD